MAAVNGSSNGHSASTNGHARNGHSGGFMLKDTSIENFRPMRVVVVGAGFSGILAAIRIPERLRNIDLTVYEKNEAVGGVWWLNKYPGVACDVPSHSYQYTFAPNPRWSNLYAPGSEIQQYLQNVAQKFGATRFIKTSHRVDDSVWDDKEKKWKLTVHNLLTGETFEDAADVLFLARGQLNEVSWPKIPGLDKFQGKVMHSGLWDENYDFRNKKVGIIGNGSSAIQIIPSLQKLEGVQMTCFMRSPTWISGQFGDHAMMTLGLDPSKTDFTPPQRDALAADPAAYLAMRKVIEDDGNTIHDSTLRGTTQQQHFQEIFRSGMEAKLASRPDLAAALIPTDFSPGCRRLTPGKGFLEALAEPNVRVLHAPIVRVDADNSTVVVVVVGRRKQAPQQSQTQEEDGEEEEEEEEGEESTGPFDVLICATGFRAGRPALPRVVGRDGTTTLEDRWTPRPESYLSLGVDGFPNLLLLFGPNSAIGFGSLTKMLEAEVDYATRVLRKAQKEDYASFEPRRDRVRDFTRFVDAYFRKTVYVEKCKSWYKSDGGNGGGVGGESWITGLWPGSTLHALEALRAPRWEDWVWESIEDGGEEGGGGNGLRWLGNGWSTTQTDGDPSWYLNANEVEVPLDGKPEEAVRFKARPWSH